MSRMDFDTLFRDRRPAENRPAPEQTELAPEVEEQPEQMSEQDILDSIRIPSAHPGPGVMMMGRVRDRDLCRHCSMPLFSHGAGVYESHVPEPMPNGQRTPGTHADVEDGRSRNTAGPRPTPRRAFD